MIANPVTRKEAAQIIGQARTLTRMASKRFEAQWRRAKGSDREHERNLALSYRDRARGMLEALRTAGGGYYSPILRGDKQGRDSFRIQRLTA